MLKEYYTKIKNIITLYFVICKSIKLIFILNI